MKAWRSFKGRHLNDAGHNTVTLRRPNTALQTQELGAQFALELRDLLSQQIALYGLRDGPEKSLGRMVVRMVMRLRVRMRVTVRRR